MTQEHAEKNGRLYINKDIEPNVCLAALGDLDFHDVVNDVLDQEAPTVIFQGVHVELKKADLRIANLETVIAENIPEYVKQSKKALLITTEKAIDAMKAVMIDVVTCANNHVMDAGAGGLCTSIDLIRKAGIELCGAGKNYDEAHKPVNRNCNGVHFSFYAYGFATGQIAKYDKPGCAEVSLNQILVDTEISRAESGVTVVSIHSDAEFQKVPSPRRIELCRKLIDEGVEIVLCHHPHVPQGIEKRGKGVIIYSLGNYVSPISNYMKAYSSECDKSFHVNIYVGEKGVAFLDIVPIMINDRGLPAIAQGGERHAVLAMIDERSRMLSDGECVTQNYVVMITTWIKKQLRILYWALRKGEFLTIWMVVKDMIQTKMKHEWLRDYIVYKLKSKL